MLQMPPLRSHLQDIPRLSGLYISTLNMRNARAVIGFEPEANLCMTEYSWPGNYDQFCRVLDELVLHTTTPYISVETVRDQLKRECTFYPGAVPQPTALPVRPNAGRDRANRRATGLASRKRQPETCCRALGHQPHNAVANAAKGNTPSI